MRGKSNSGVGAEERTLSLRARRRWANSLMRAQTICLAKPGKNCVLYGAAKKPSASKAEGTLRRRRGRLIELLRKLLKRIPLNGVVDQVKRCQDKVKTWRGA